MIAYKILSKKICLFMLFLTCLTANLAAESIKNREVPYTEDLYNFINLYLNYKISDSSLLDSLYTLSAENADKNKDTYASLVLKARCLYYYGLVLMQTYDVTDISNKDLTDKKEAPDVNELAGKYFDKSIELCEEALKIKEGSDAYTTLAFSISANCTAKNVLYIIGNGLKVKNYAKKALKTDPENGTALFLVWAQDIYAPKPFCRLNSGRDEMIKILNDDKVLKEDFDFYYLESSVAFSYFRQNEFEKAREWYEKSIEKYPDNYLVNCQLKKIKENKNSL